MRWEAMMAKLRTGTIQQWFADFTDALQECKLDKDALAPMIVEPSRWPMRSASNSNARYH
jgi:trehalose 6-phosphate synthase